MACKCVCCLGALHMATKWPRLRKPSGRAPLVFLMAGEPSGDALGAQLMTALRREYGPELRFAGVGGDKMTAQGLSSLFPMAELSVMGFVELVPVLPRLMRRLSQTIAAARATSPDLVVGIDAKAFCLRVHGALSADRARQQPSGEAGPRLVQYVAPSAWAFADAPRRASKLSHVVDELLCLLPFEVPLFEAAGVPSTFVGHPAALDCSEAATGWRGRDIHGVVRNALCVLPGSRAEEIAANLPPMLEAAEKVAASHRLSGHVIDRLLLPTPPAVRAAVEAHLCGRPEGGLRAVVTSSERERHDAFGTSRLALACCGTVNVELARARTPQVAVYRSSRVTSWIVRHLLRPTTPYATLPNILRSRAWQSTLAADAAPSSSSSPWTGAPPPTSRAKGDASFDGARTHDEGPSRTPALIPELLFEQCTADAIASAAIGLLADPSAAAAQAQASAQAIESMVARDTNGCPVQSATAAARALLHHLPV